MKHFFILIVFFLSTGVLQSQSSNDGVEFKAMALDGKDMKKHDFSFYKCTNPRPIESIDPSISIKFEEFKTAFQCKRMGGEDKLNSKEVVALIGKRNTSPDSSKEYIYSVPKGDQRNDKSISVFKISKGEFYFRTAQEGETKEIISKMTTESENLNNPQHLSQSRLKENVNRGREVEQSSNIGSEDSLLILILIVIVIVIVIVRPKNIKVLRLKIVEWIRRKPPKHQPQPPKNPHLINVDNKMSEKRISELEKWRSESEKRISELEKWNSELEKWNSELEKRISELEKKGKKSSPPTVPRLPNSGREGLKERLKTEYVSGVRKTKKTDSFLEYMRSDSIEYVLLRFNANRGGLYQDENTFISDTPVLIAIKNENDYDFLPYVKSDSFQGPTYFEYTNNVTPNNFTAISFGKITKINGTFSVLKKGVIS